MGSFSCPPTPQDHLLEFLVSPAFAFGLGSGYDGHMATFAHSYAVMWIHTVVGSVTVVAGLMQFSDRIRQSRPELHRAIGKLFLAGSVVVSVSGAAYLLRTPAQQVFSGVAFAEVLWLLAIGTFTTAVLALIAILRRDVTAHREYVAVLFALICSAPMLRYGWLGVTAIWDTNKEMANLVEISWLGPLLVTAAIIYTRPFGNGRDRGSSPLATTQALQISAALGGAGIAILGVIALNTHWSMRAPIWFTGGWLPLVANFVLPFLLQTVVFAVLADRARRLGYAPAAVAWRTYLCGNFASPAVGVAFLWFTIAAYGVPLTQAWWTVPLGWNLALFAAYVGHTALTTRREMPPNGVVGVRAPQQSVKAGS
ncbi:DUF2306 domain-containing protein [Mycobacterium paraterrae]|uniref:DUF2306 domain-containing protein n=1 Tax=Mycobacterium paraterrae TaxID=577492 RepID=A0ABY3VU17_9MYCO|nr:DUF2306 domain-containing protein [Mycobacterium paraterrae]UMB71557.1 DUF2306 domain-containing protein [Mycobacterium paraterrae]